MGDCDWIYGVGFGKLDCVIGGEGWDCYPTLTVRCGVDEGRGCLLVGCDVMG